MSKLTSLISLAPKRLVAAVLMVAAAVIIPSAVLAWGPDRTIYHWNQPAADHVVFNSFIDNPVHGDERNFMRVREANASASTYADSIALQANKEYVVHMYYHNNAKTSLNDAAHNYAGVAKNAYVKAQIPGLVAKGSTGTVAEGYIGASNATPKEVWDEVSFSNATGSDLSLTYVPGSATIHNFGAANGQVMSDSIVTTGAPIGYNSLNGDVPGCNEFSGYVTFKVKTTQSDFSVEKQVRLAGQTEYKENVVAKPGDTLEYRIQYINTGTIKHANVVIKDVLPSHVTYVPGSTTVKNTSHPNGKTVNDDLVAGGINIGDYTPGANAYIKFQAKVNAKSTLPCGTTTLTNKASAQVGNGVKEDTATATVSVECKTDECKPGIPVNDKRCEDTPPELPKTGASENIVAIIGLGALIASIAYYVASRRATNQ